MPAYEASRMGTASDRGSELVVGGQRVELQLTSISACTLRVSLLPIAADGSVLPAANRSART